VQPAIDHGPILKWENNRSGIGLAPIIGELAKSPTPRPSGENRSAEPTDNTGSRLLRRDDAEALKWLFCTPSMLRYVWFDMVNCKVESCDTSNTVSQLSIMKGQPPDIVVGLFYSIFPFNRQLSNV
jgi:hypothetical protein